jgi:tetratricopeptide (TPR) repeat protein
MNADTAIAWIDRSIALETGKHLNDLQILTIEQIWLGKKYIEIAEEYHCTEGHVKDTAADLWQLLSQLLGEKVTKSNLKSLLQRHVAPIVAPLKLVPNYHFIGRETAILRLDELIQQGQRTIAIQGTGGIGKTTLAQEYLKTCGCDLILELSMAKETAQIAPVEIIVEEWLRSDLQIEPGREFSVTLLRLKRQLMNRKIGILIDNLEPALDREGRIIAVHRGYVELFRVLTDRQLPGVTLITSRDRLCEIDLNLAHYRLSGLDLETWQLYFNYRQIVATAAAILPIHQAYGGNAKAMEIIAGSIYADFDGDLEAYLQSSERMQSGEAGLQQLISDRFDRLQQLDPDAYRLLCRAGCYRYRDLDRVSVDALLALLWDVEKSQQLKVINSLKNRSAIECDRGKYWLHPSVRAEAISRLQQTDSWIESHQHAAKFWSDLVTEITDVSSAITALEAYYHYVEIGDIHQAVRVLLQPRSNQWGQFLPLASNLYRLGAIQPVLAAIVQIMPSLQPSRSTAELSNILGDLDWIIGRVREAIAAQQYAIEYTSKTLAKLDPEDRSHDTYCLKILEIDSLLSVGLYHIDLWELMEASCLFERVIALARDIDAPNLTIHQRDRWTRKAIVCLALVRSYLGDETRARALLTSIESTTSPQQSTGSNAYFLQIIGQTYANLGEYDFADKIYHQTLAFCQTGTYLQIQGRTLASLAQLYRWRGELAIAQTTHLQAIEILDSLGAKCDLAAAYYQAGLTWQQAGDLRQHHLYCHVYAHRLFTEIDAPRQLARLSL